MQPPTGPIYWVDLGESDGTRRSRYAPPKSKRLYRIRAHAKSCVEWHSKRGHPNAKIYRGDVTWEED